MKIAGVVASPNAITVYWQGFNGVMNAVYFRKLGGNSIWLYRIAKSSVVQNFKPARVPNIFSTRSSGCAFLFVIMLSLQKSMQKRQLSFF